MNKIKEIIEFNGGVGIVRDIFKALDDGNITPNQCSERLFNTPPTPKARKLLRELREYIKNNYE